MTMTLWQAMRQAQAALQAAFPPDASHTPEDARFDALCLAEQAFGLDKTQLRLRARQPVDPTEYFALVSRRAAREPLQYILGRWEFYGLPFCVGPGVLIPRPETEHLVALALQFLSEPGMRGAEVTAVDLCAGSGCVGLAVAHHCPNTQVHLIERSPAALPYLRKNAAPYPNAHVHEADVLNCELRITNCEVILANPPYIPTGELAALSREVRQEPAMALDGGTDGLDFYRGIAARWLPRLAPGGLLAAECGEGQAGALVALFAPCQTKILLDFNGIERIVAARA